MLLCQQKINNRLALAKNLFTVRSVSVESATTQGQFLKSGDNLNFAENRQWYKVHDGGDGDVISGITKMDQNHGVQ